MDYYIDFEFNEGFTRPLLSKPRHYIEMISVGIVCSDGREYSALSKEYRYADCNDWVKKNVIRQLYWKTVSGDQRNRWEEHNFHRYYGTSNKEIADEILAFTSVSERHLPDITFYGYYSGYDWVLLCSLYGTMMNLPSGWPKYCRDLKQMVDEQAGALILPPEVSLEERVSHIGRLNGYPVDNNQHDALADAHWNRALHKFLTSQRLI
jgi:hypothetical protein